MSGFLEVKSSVSFCMRIMSPLFTVAMVSFVSALAENATPPANSAQSAAPVTRFIVPPKGLCTRWANYLARLIICSGNEHSLNLRGVCQTKSFLRCNKKTPPKLLTGLFFILIQKAFCGGYARSKASAVASSVISVVISLPRIAPRIAATFFAPLATAIVFCAGIWIGALVTR